jgi:hypothetical protein
MTEEIESIENIVAGLNARIFDHIEKEGANPEHSNFFTFEGNGDWQSIKFLDLVIWDSENDERNDHPAQEEVKEDLQVHVLRVAQALLKSIGTLKL